MPGERRTKAAPTNAPDCEQIAKIITERQQILQIRSELYQRRKLGLDGPVDPSRPTYLIDVSMRPLGQPAPRRLTWEPPRCAELHALVSRAYEMSTIPGGSPSGNALAVSLGKSASIANRSW